VKAFNDLLLESIDESVAVLLSRQVVDALYLHLETTHSISRNDVPYKLDTLIATLQRTLGSGAQTVGRAIARRFYLKLQLEFTNNPNHTLLEYVDEAKRKLQFS
jgi:hypothetical protein